MDAFSLGQLLRQAREEKNYKLEDVEQVLKIRKFILIGFEDGNFNVMEASPVQIRGFLRNYCNFLGLDEDIILNYYDGIQDAASTKNKRKKTKTQPKRTTQETAVFANTETYPTIKQRPQSGNISRRLLRLALVFLLSAVTIGVIAYVVLQLVSPTSDDQQQISENQVTNEAIDETDQLPTLTLTPTATPTRAIGTATLIPRSPQTYQNEPVLVTIEFDQRTWISISQDGEEVYTGTIRPDELIMEYPAFDALEITASNAAALLVTYNGQPQPPLGARGEEVSVIYRPDNDIQVNLSGTGYGAVAQVASSTPTIELLDTSNEAGADNLAITPPPTESTDSSAIAQPTSLPILGNPTPLPQVQDESITVTNTPTLPAIITITPVPDSTTTDSTSAGEQNNAAPTATPTQEVVQPSATPAVLLPDRITSTPNIPPKFSQ